MTDDPTDTPAADDPHDLRRFVDAQRQRPSDPHYPSYPKALAEIRAGCKESHWMWYIFPQFDGLGYSATAKQYAIRSLDEARAYLADPLLGPPLVEIAEAAAAVPSRSAEEIFGTVDAMKLRSSATLFAQISPAGSVFHRLLDRFFQGRPDDKTLALLADDRG